MASKKQSKHASKANTKRTKQFAAKGQLKAQIDQRRKNQAQQKKIKVRQMLKERGKGKKKASDPTEDLQPDDAPKATTVDELLNMEFDQDDGSEGSSELESDHDDLESLDSFADDAEAHKMDLAGLKDRDPEFYQYLLENDKALLDFEADDDDAGLDDEANGDGPTLLTLALLADWQKALVASHSLKALRKLLLAFKVAASGEEAAGEAGPAFAIQDPEVFRKLIKTVLKFTPVVLLHHMPAKKLNSGKFKVPTQHKKYAAVQRCIKSFFLSLTRLFASIPTDTSEEAAQGESLALLACVESAKLVPFIVGNRKVAKGYIKLMLEQWGSSGLDRVKLSAFLAVRTVALAGDASLQELVLKSTYGALVSAFKQTSVYTMPTINLMKNSALELFLVSSGTAYQLAFSYIRQLALQLRAATKSQDQNAFQQIYNWQAVHAIDFWSLVLSNAADPERVAANGASDMEQLIFPLVQVGLGVIRYLPTSRFFPLHLHVIKSLLRITIKTGHFVPLVPSLLNMLNCSEFKRKPKPSTQLKGLDFEYAIRAPKAYIRTKTYADNLGEELAFAIVEVFEAHSRSIAFPELVIPALVTLKRTIKSSSAPHLVGVLKPVVEKLEANKAFIEKKRAKIEFTPSDRSQVDAFLRNDDDETPLSALLRRERKVRAKKRELMEKVANEDEIMEEASL